MRLVKTGMLTTALFFSVATSTWADVTITKAGKLTKYVVDIDGVNYQTVELSGRKFLKATFDGVKGYEAIAYAVGKPEIPVIRFYVNGGEEGIVVSSPDAKNSVSTQLSMPVVPNQAAVAKRANVKKLFSMNGAAYSENRFLHMEASKVERVGSFRGVPRSLVTLYPLSYNPRAGQIVLRKHFEITINSASEIADATPYATRQGMIAYVVAKEFENSPALDKYIDFKQALGFTSKKIIFGKDVTTIDGVRSALKATLADASNDLRFAIIVGDSTGVPAKSADHMYGLTDHYYRAIDTADYESDINTPDIGLGRLSVETEEQLANVVEKYIRYENGIFSTGAWLTQAAWLGTSDSGYYQVAEGTHNYVIDTHAKNLGYQGHFPQANMQGGDKLYAISHNATGENAVDAINHGRVLITYSGHGSTGGWVGPDFGSAEVLALDNPDFIPFVLGFACNTGDYSGSDGFAEAWQRHKFGAVLYLGSVDSSYWDEDDILQKRLYDGIFSDDIVQFGSMMNFALSEVWRHYGGEGYSEYYWETYTTFADPSMTLRKLN
jgi:hypothetical protein